MGSGSVAGIRAGRAEFRWHSRQRGLSPPLVKDKRQICSALQCGRGTRLSHPGNSDRYCYNEEPLPMILAISNLKRDGSRILPDR